MKDSRSSYFSVSVNSISYKNDELYIGGEFQENLGSPINFLGKMSSIVGLNENTSEPDFEVYPNPFESVLSSYGVEEGTKNSILYIDGRMADEGTVKNQKINYLGLLPKGSNVLHLESAK